MQSSMMEPSYSEQVILTYTAQRSGVESASAQWDWMGESGGSLKISEAN